MRIFDRCSRTEARHLDIDRIILAAQKAQFLGLGVSRRLLFQSAIVRCLTRLRPLSTTQLRFRNIRVRFFHVVVLILGCLRAQNKSVISHVVERCRRDSLEENRGVLVRCSFEEVISSIHRSAARLISCFSSWHDSSAGEANGT